MAKKKKREHKARPSSGGTRKYGRSKRRRFGACQCQACREARRSGPSALSPEIWTRHSRSRRCPGLSSQKRTRAE